MHTVLQARKINQNIKKNRDKILPPLTLLGLKCCLFILLVTSVWNRNKSELSQCIQASLYDSAQQNNSVLHNQRFAGIEIKQIQTDDFFSCVCL